MLSLLKLAQHYITKGHEDKANEVINSFSAKLLIVPKKRKMIKACMVVLGISKSRYFDAVC